MEKNDLLSLTEGNAMVTYNSILKKLKDVPADRLDEVEKFVHSLSVNKGTDDMRSKIMSFAGSFAEMSDKDYKDFLDNNTLIRDELFRVCL